MFPAGLLPPSLLFTSGWEGKRSSVSPPAAEQPCQHPTVGFFAAVQESSLATAAGDLEQDHLPVKREAE